MATDERWKHDRGALLCVREGDRVVVNDLGCACDGSGQCNAAARVVADIRALGGNVLP